MKKLRLPYVIPLLRLIIEAMTQLILGTAIFELPDRTQSITADFSESLWSSDVA